MSQQFKNTGMNIFFICGIICFSKYEQNAKSKILNISNTSSIKGTVQIIWIIKNGLETLRKKFPFFKNRAFNLSLKNWIALELYIVS